MLLRGGFDLRNAFLTHWDRVGASLIIGWAEDVFRGRYTVGLIKERRANEKWDST
jgi:hypothetical protein